MKTKIKRLFYPFFLGVIFVSAFFHYNQYESFRSQPPAFYGSQVEPFAQNGVHIFAKAYNPSESHAYLDRNLLSKGIRPIQVTVMNNTGNEYILSKKGVDLKEASSSSVAHSVTRSYYARSIAFKVAALFFWPFAIPSVIDTVLTYQHHHKMKGDYEAKSIKEKGEILLPYSTTHRVLFVRQNDFQDSFTLYLQDRASGKYSSYPTKIEII